jgi:O-antigen/teichoic acid export membrane protein
VTALARRLLVAVQHAVAWNVAARGGDLAAAAVGTWLVARSGGPSLVGYFTLLRVVPATLGVVVAGGLPTAAAYFLAGPTRADRRVPTTLIAVAACGGVVGVLAWTAGTPVLQRLFFQDLATPLVMVAGLRVFTYLAFSSGRACLQGIGDLGGSNWIILGEDAFFVPAYACCLALGVRGPLAMIAALLLGDVANAVLAWGLLLRRRFLARPAWPSLTLARRVYGFGARGQLGNLLLLLNFRLDFAILGVLAGPATLGVYAIASRYAELVRLLPVSVFWVFYPEYARSEHAAALARTRALIPRLGALSLVIAIPVGLSAIVALPWVFGSAFQAGVVPCQILLVGLVAEGVGGIVTPYLYGEGRPGMNSLAVGAGVVVTIALDVLLIPRFGAVGAACASSVAYATVTAVLLAIFWRIGSSTERLATGRATAP